jgi:hypothetical protein
MKLQDSWLYKPYFHKVFGVERIGGSFYIEEEDTQEKRSVKLFTQN